MRALQLLFLLGLCGTLHAYPDRPVTLVVPFTPTGTPDIYGVPRITKLIKMMQTLSTPSLTDSLANEVVQALGGAFDRPVTFDRHPRGKTIPGTLYAARAKPDGHTLLFAGSQTITIYPTLHPQAAFDPLRQLAPVALVARMPIALITAADNPARSVADIREHARRLAGQVNYAAVGDGSTAHLTGELFRHATGTEIVHVNYNGSVPAINAVVTRHVEFGFVPLAAVLPYIEGRRLRVIAIASAARHAAMPETPTIAESGLPGFEASGWFGVLAPARTSAAIVSLLNYEINKALHEDAAQRSFTAMGLNSMSATPEEFAALIERDSKRWSQLLKTASTGHQQ